MITANELWNCKKEEKWHEVLDLYWNFVKPSHLEVEKEFDNFDSDTVRGMDPKQWYDFLLKKYFFWKYTAPNRYKTTTHHLKKYVDGTDTLEKLYNIKEKIFRFDKMDIEKGLIIACEIRGLGVAGASGLLSVLFPSNFATVDQFVVKFLRNINALPEMHIICKMNPEGLNIKDGYILIQIMKKKAEELNENFNTSFWSSRKIDMALWTLGR